jgi:hypothetical protein
LGRVDAEEGRHPIDQGVDQQVVGDLAAGHKPLGAIQPPAALGRLGRLQRRQEQIPAGRLRQRVGEPPALAQRRREQLAGRRRGHLDQPDCRPHVHQPDARRGRAGLRDRAHHPAEGAHRDALAAEGDRQEGHVQAAGVQLAQALDRQRGGLLQLRRPGPEPARQLGNHLQPRCGRPQPELHPAEPAVASVRSPGLVRC